jgi:hypothetical protein
MDKATSQKLLRALGELQQLAKKIVETGGYTSETEKVKALEDLIREQVRNENTRTTARQAR